MFWTAQDVPEGWTVDSGYREEGEARWAAENLATVYPGSIGVLLLPTREHEIPSDDPAFTEAHVFAAERWCVLVKEEPRDA